nr:S8 family serine peptidase [Sporolactobacillus kofuensis]
MLILSSWVVTPTSTYASNDQKGLHKDVAHAYISKPGEKIRDPLKKTDKNIQSSNLSKNINPNKTIKLIVELKSPSILQNYDHDKSKLTAASYIATKRMKSASKKMLVEQTKIKKQIIDKVDKVSFKNSYNYTTALNGFSVQVPYKEINKIKKLNGVKSVHEAVTYSLPDEKTINNNKVSLQSLNTSSDLIGADLANQSGFTGKGTVVAVLDSGLDTQHEAFNTMPKGPLKYTQAAIGEKVKSSDLQASKNTDLSTNSTYVDDKVPYAYDYAGKDTNVRGGADHGTHVSGIIAGNNTAIETDEAKQFKGVAPDAQLMMMKVFADGTGSTTDDIILAGLEDAVKLGADAINMSLGSPAGSPTSGDPVTDEVYRSVSEAGIDLLVAAGNDTSSSVQNTTGVNLNPANSPDTAIVGSPSSYASALSVASSESSSFQSKYFTLGGQDGEKIPYADAVNVQNNKMISLTTAINNNNVSYVYLNKYGFPEDYDGVDVKGKIAVVNRGGTKSGESLTFQQKADNAEEAGARAVIVVNNVAGAISSPGVQTDDIIPTVFISQNDGKKLADAALKTIYVSSSFVGILGNPGAGMISSFSSIGPSPNLGIKPEITAPGGNIYSSINGGKYELMSGTSMATPQLSGVSSLLKQYLNSENRFDNLSPIAKADLIEYLEMSTATPIKDTNDIAYPVRRQGAGLVNVEKAIETPAYLTVNGGRPKAELGSIAREHGQSILRLQIHQIKQSIIRLIQPY